jgi:hypothetical protein
MHKPVYAQEMQVQTACPSGYVARCAGGNTFQVPVSCACNVATPTGTAQPTPTPSMAGTAPVCGNQGIPTALGCIPVGNTNSFIAWLLRWGIGIGGGISFMLIVVASFQIMTSSSDPTRLKAGQELLTSAIAGLIMLIFSIFILKVIGVDILGLPGFGN